MNTFLKIKNSFLLPVLFIVILASCKKETDTTSDDITSSGTIAVVASLSAVSAASPTDSLYVLQPCNDRATRTSITESDLPAVVQSYISTNYTGYTFYKAFVIKNRTGVTTGYVAVVYYNSKPVALEFDASGAFKKILEQREKADLHNQGHHRGGRFEERGNLGKDTIALASLSSGIVAYFSANYATDTLIKAYRNCDSTIVLLSKNNGLFATLFTSNGTFINRKQVTSIPCRLVEITQATLPANVSSYLDVTYPNYVFKKAFKRNNNNNVLVGYVVFIDANNTKYAIEFDAAGNFLKVKTVH